MTLNKEDREQMIQIYFDKSVKAFKTCLSLCNDEDIDCDAATNRAYYSIFLMEKALLLTKGISEDSHKHAHMAISKEFVKEGILPDDTYKRIKSVEAFRHLADYSGTSSVSKDGLYNSIREANLFLKSSKEFLFHTLPEVFADKNRESEKTHSGVEKTLQLLCPERFARDRDFIHTASVSDIREKKNKSNFELAQELASTKHNVTHVSGAITGKTYEGTVEDKAHGYVFLKTGKSEITLLKESNIRTSPKLGEHVRIGGDFGKEREVSKPNENTLSR